MTDSDGMLGTTIANKYRIERVLGEGGMGVVYQGTHEGTGGKVAVKMLRKEAFGDPEHFDRFELEARVSSRIETGHVIRVYDCGKERGAPFLVMELLQGQSLGQLIAANGPLPERLALKIIAQAALGLGRAHAANVIHRDIKADNLFLAHVDDAVVVKVLDFGIAKLRRNVGDPTQDNRLTETGRLLGTPLYMSPEQAQGEVVDHRTDIWSLGIVLFEALTGKPPLIHVQNLGKLIVELCAAPPPLLRRLLPDASPAVEDLLARALMLDPALRFATVDELRAEILRVLGEGHHVAVGDLAYPRIETPSERGVLSTDRVVLPTTVSKPPRGADTRADATSPDDPAASPRGPHDATLASPGVANGATHPDGTPIAARDAPPLVEERAAPPLPPLVAHAGIVPPESSTIALPRRHSTATWGIVGAVVLGGAVATWAVSRDAAPTPDRASASPTNAEAPRAVAQPSASTAPAAVGLPPQESATIAPTTTVAPSTRVASPHGSTRPASPSVPTSAPTPVGAGTTTDPPHAGSFE